MPDPSPETLDDWAEHVRYEVWALVGQLTILIDRYGVSGPQGSMSNPEGEALLEAALVHLRLLDEFLDNKPRHGTDLKASMWVEGWEAEAWLDAKVRKRMDQQLIHLSSQRDRGYEWDLHEYGLACCKQMLRFFGQIGDPERLDAFWDAPELAEAGRLRFEELT